MSQRTGVEATELGYPCDIEVQVRNIGHYARTPQQMIDEVKEQFAELMPPPPKNGTFETQATTTQLNASDVDKRPSALHRYNTIALVFVGPVAFQIVAQANDWMKIASVLALARNVKGSLFREIYGLRFGEFVSVCNERVGTSQEVNMNALAKLDFNSAYLIDALQKQDSTMTPQTFRDMIARQLGNFWIRLMRSLRRYGLLSATAFQN